MYLFTLHTATLVLPILVTADGLPFLSGVTCEYKARGKP